MTANFSWEQGLQWGAALAGLVVVSVLTRSFFFLRAASLSMPVWVEKGLRYAPLAALAAVVAPDVLLTQGQWSGHWHDSRLIAAFVAMSYAVWRRDMLGTIVVGMAVFLPLKLVLGW
jgi:branched-subunit amino acid transport protein